MKRPIGFSSALAVLGAAGTLAMAAHATAPLHLSSPSLTTGAVHITHTLQRLGTADTIGQMPEVPWAGLLPIVGMALFATRLRKGAKARA
ncbi:MAG: hypothetical protein OWU32_04265 [Firmicutes bacterium]|nr:hypothetical protein [Bacillota bacterium]